MSEERGCSGWSDLNGISLRKQCVYESMKWSHSVDLESVVHFAAAPFAGPVALAVRGDASSARPSLLVHIFTSAGYSLGRIVWQDGNVVGLAWTAEEHLLVVRDDGMITFYNMFGIRQGEPVSMGAEAKLSNVLAFRPFDSYDGTGMAVITSKHRLFVNEHIKLTNNEIWVAAAVPKRSEQAPSCWTVVSRGRAVRVVMALGGDVFVLTRKGAEQLLPAVASAVKQYVDVCASADNSKLALLSENGLVQITSLDARSVLCECGVTANYSAPVRGMHWCGNEALVCLESDRQLTAVGMAGNLLRFSFDEKVFIAAEMDGLRVFSQTRHEFLARVPDAVSAVFKVASSAPGALLFEAFEKYKACSHQTYDYLKMINENLNGLNGAVKQCVEAAGHELSTCSQKALLGAASFGSSFCEEVDASVFVSMCRLLRVLNALRERHIGLPLTYTQLERLSVGVLLDRLIARSHWPLAVACARHLRLGADAGVNRVLAHWALRKIDEFASKPASTRSRAENEQLSAAICAKFRDFPGVSYADVAAEATKRHLTELATMLLDNEPEIRRQVKMLLQLDEWERALSKANDSGDPQLINCVILHKRQQATDRSGFELRLRNFPLALALYKRGCAEESAEKLRSLFKQEDDFAGEALCWLRQAADVSSFDARDKLKCLAEAERCLSSVREESLAQHVADGARLLRLQVQLEERFDQPFAELSLRETLVWLIEHGGEAARVEALRKEFKISEKQLWWWRVEALARGKRWQDLTSLAKSKKSPIGYYVSDAATCADGRAPLQPFVLACVQHGNLVEARSYLSRLPTVDEQVVALIKINDLEAAAQLAFDNGREALLNRCLSSASAMQSRSLYDRIGQMKQRLADRRK